MSARNFDLNGTARRFGNVTIERLNGLTKVLLHGNNVVEIDHAKRLVKVSNCGWVTPTTHSAIKTALSQLPDTLEIQCVWSNKGTSMVHFADDNKPSRPLVNGETFKF